MNERHFNDVGEVLDYAIAREVEAYEFYRDLATRVKAAKLREVLLGFAAEEVEHKVLLERAKAGDVEIGRDSLRGPASACRTRVAMLRIARVLIPLA